jgi:hypothetical protein
MPIHIPVQKPDGTVFGFIDIACVEAVGREPDSVNIYEASVVEHPGDVPRTVTVAHRYGDHWTVLLAKALDAYKMCHPHNPMNR